MVKLISQPKTFVIAIKDHLISEQQLNDCLKSAEKYDWHVEIFWGINGNTVSSETWASQGLRLRTDKFISDKPGVQGCFLSHYVLWNKCVELDEPIIILEHDAIIQQPWAPILLENSIVKLHRHYKRKTLKYDTDSGLWSPSGHAYCLSPRHAETLINFVKRVGAYEVDVVMGDKVIGIEHINPSLVERQNLYSTTTNL